MKPSGDRLGVWEKTEWANLGDQIKSRTDRHILRLHW